MAIDLQIKQGRFVFGLDWAVMSFDTARDSTKAIGQSEKTMLAKGLTHTFKTTSPASKEVTLQAGYLFSEGETDTKKKAKYPDLFSAVMSFGDFVLDQADRTAFTIGLFRLPAGQYWLALMDKTGLPSITPPGDNIFDNLLEALEKIKYQVRHLVHVSGNGFTVSFYSNVDTPESTLNLINALVAQKAEWRKIELEDCLKPTAGDKLTPIKERNTGGKVFNIAAVFAILIIGYTQYGDLLFGEPKRTSRTVDTTVIVDPPHWASPSPRAVAQKCFDALTHIYLPLPGWDPSNTDCRQDGDRLVATVIYNSINDDGSFTTIADAEAAIVEQVKNSDVDFSSKREIPQKRATFTINSSLTEARGKQDLLPTTHIQTFMADSDGFAAITFDLKVEGVRRLLTAEQVTVNHRINQMNFSLRTSFHPADIAAELPAGAVLNELSFDLQQAWTMKGQLHAF